MASGKRGIATTSGWVRSGEYDILHKAMARIRGPIPFNDFKQRVRRHRTSDVLRTIAAISAEIVNAEFRSRGPARESTAIQHFSLAAVARAAVLYGNEHRSQLVAREDVRAMCGYYLEVQDPALIQQPGLDRLRGMMTRVIYEQASFQYSEMENVGRSVALLIDQAADCEGALSATEWQELLGVTLQEFMRIGFGMHVAALQNGGQISRDLLKAPHVVPIFTPLPVDRALEVIDAMYAGTVTELRDIGRTAEASGLEKWSLNPLQVKPIVAMGEGYIMPIPRYVLDRFTPTGLYFIALARHGSRFTDALGCMFERYVGAQLGQLGAWSIYPEIVYGPHGEKTVDFFVVTNTCVLLVEVKTARPIEATRFGAPSSDDDIEKKIGRAIEQINNSVGLLDVDPALAHINPGGLPVRGMVVTLEPFHLIGTPLYADVLTPASVPTVVVSAHELEGFIAAVLPEPDPGVYLHKAFTAAEEEGTNSLSAAVKDLEHPPNPILAEAWDRFMRPIDELRLEADDLSAP